MKKINLIFIIGILLIGIASAATTCCEKTNSGAWCQNVNDPTQCDSSHRAVSSYCEATSYCKLGTCINQLEGTCITSPEITCTNNGGYWSALSQDKLSQCKLGCCLIGNQAAFVTQVACNRMASLYGLDVNYRSDIQNELTCLASANPGVKGACVYTKDSVTTCELTTKEDCQTLAKSKTDAIFHEGFLCSAQQLGTVCAKSQNTKCDGDSVYFLDTCGNLANVYDATKINNENYWTYIQNPTCGDGAGNKNSATCGACDYYYGSMCGDKGIKSVSYGNYMCNSLDCENYTGPFPYGGKPKHGDSWCETDNRNGGNETSPGSTYFRLVCYNGDVTTEECGNGDSGGTRQEICAENISTRTGNCKVNVWQDCTNQTTKDDCENIDVRDCKWMQWAKGESCTTTGGLSQLGGLFSSSSCSNNNYYFSDKGLSDTTTSVTGACVPNYPPGFENSGNDTTTIIGGASCSQADSSCLVTYAKIGVLGSWNCVSNCMCETNGWAQGLNGICSQLGDCGVKNNYIGKSGLNTINKSYSISKCADGSKRTGC